MVLIRKPFIGLGTGRMGTTSLQKLVGACQNTIVGHEQKQYLTAWHEDKNIHKIDRLIEWLESNAQKGLLVGEVTPSLVPRVDYIRDKIDVKIICLHRSKEEVVESYMKKCKNRSLILPDQKWSNWCKYAPTISAKDVRTSYEAYWELYERVAADITDAYHFNTHDLSNKKSLEQLFKFLDIPKGDWEFLKKTKWNIGC